MRVCTEVKKECKTKINTEQLYVQILINHISDLIIKSEFFEVFRDFRGINFSEKCVNVSCCMELMKMV